MLPIFIINNKDGQSKFENKESFVNYVQSLGNGRIDVAAKKHRKPRSTGKDDELGNQNGYYRGVVVPMFADFNGYTQKEMHEVFLIECAPYIYRNLGDKKIAIKIRTRDMDTMQMTTYIESCRGIAAQMGCFIPDPDKVN